MSDHDETIRQNDDTHEAASEDGQHLSPDWQEGVEELYADGDEILILDADLDPTFDAVDAYVEVTEPTAIQPESSRIRMESTYVPPVDPASASAAEVLEGEAQPMVVRTTRGARRNWFLSIGGIAAALLVGGGYMLLFGEDPGQPAPPTKVATASTHATPATPVAPGPTKEPAAAQDPKPVAASPGAAEVPEPPNPQPAPSDPEPVEPPKPVPAPPPSREPAPVERPTPVAAKTDDAVLRELVQIALVEGFATMGQISGERRSGIRVRLSGGKEVVLAHGESLVELKNGNHFKGVIIEVNESFITMKFSYGKMRIPKRDLNQVVPTTHADLQPLDSYRTAIVHLGNGNHLRGKVVKVAEDRVVLGFPSAQIIVPRSAMAAREDAVEYIEAENRRQLFGSGRGHNTSANRAGGAGTEQGAAYYDFVNGFVIIPPQRWEKFTKDAIIGFKAAPEAELQGALSLGGLYVRSTALPAALDVLASTLPTDVQNVEITQPIRRTTKDEAPWDYQFDCRQQVATVDDPFAPARQEKLPAMVCRIYVFNRFGKVFILAMFASEPEFKRMIPKFDECARTFEYRS